MNSQFNAFLATSHQSDLNRRAAASRRAGGRTAAAAKPFPTFLRSRRLGRLVEIVPAADPRQEG
jgi:hypothetical protein